MRLYIGSNYTTTGKFFLKIIRIIGNNLIITNLYSVQSYFSKRTKTAKFISKHTTNISQKNKINNRKKQLSYYQ